MEFISDAYADKALTFLHQNPSTLRKCVDVHYVPPPPRPSIKPNAKWNRIAVGHVLRAKHCRSFVSKQCASSHSVRT